MTKKTIFFEAAGLMAAATLGAGAFALPSVFHDAGWGVALAFMFVAGAAIVFAHTLYLRAIRESGGTVHLVGLAHAAYGAPGRLLALFVDLGGLTTALLAYLILGARFIAILIPAFAPWSIALFWGLASLPLFFSLRRLATIELAGSVFVFALALVVFLTSAHPLALFSSSAIGGKGILGSFGAILFALAGWTAIRPIAELEARKGSFGRRAGVLIAGTAFAAFIYLIFVLGVFGSANYISPDTVSGLPTGIVLTLLSLLGIFSLWGAYRPIALEVAHTLEGDVRFSRELALYFAIFAPLMLFFFGLHNFGAVVGVSGGIFLGAEYFFLISGSVRKLGLRGWRRYAAEAVAILFILVALYELYHFFAG